MIRCFILIFIFFTGLEAYAQLGYLGRRKSFSIGMGTNFPISGSKPGQYNYSRDNELLLPRLSIAYNHENKKGKVNSLELCYQQLPNSLITTISEESDGYPVPAYKIIDTDSAWTKSDNIKFTIGTKKFKELGPLGQYFEFRFCGNLVVNKTMETNTITKLFIDYNYYTVDKSAAVRQSNYLVPEVSFAIGKIFPINTRLAMDLGARVSLIYGRFKNKDGNNLRLPSYTTYHPIISSKKIFSANLLEIYANIVLFK